MTRWHLVLGEQTVARIDADAVDFPWTYGRLVDAGAFDRFRPYFADPDTWPDDDDALDALCEEVHSRGGFVLRDVTAGTDHGAVTLNHDGDVVWFRHGDPA